METIILAIIAGIGITGLIAALSVINGTILWMVWPTAMEAFPRLVNEEYLTHNIHWTTAVCLSFVCGILIKASQTNNK